MIKIFCSYIWLGNIHNEFLVTFFVWNCTHGYDYPRVHFFNTKLLHTKLSVECFFARTNIGFWEEMNSIFFPENAFVFLSIVFGVNFWSKVYEWIMELTCY